MSRTLVGKRDRFGTLMLPRRGHKHACSHADFCSLGAFAESTDCARCRNDRFNAQVARDRAAAQ